MPSLSRLRSRTIDKGLIALGAIYCGLHRDKELRDLLTSLGPRGGGGSKDSTGVSEADSVSLYEAIRRRKPGVVLELGAGRSSAVIALAMGERGRFIAVEEDSKWMADHRRIIPPAQLASIDLIQRDVAVRDVDGVACAYYRDLPTAPYEFIHVDGPMLRFHGVSMSCDVVNLLPMLANRCLIVFDARETSARMARPYLERAGFVIRRHPFTMSYQFERG